MGTKIGCREGDCGACAVLVGELKNNELHYYSMTCCLMPLGNAHNKHIITVEGINMEELNPIQQAMSDEGATQCGFCTPGFVVSLAGFCLSRKEATIENAIATVDGNICRCTGYKSIERAAGKVVQLLKDRNGEEPAEFAVGKKILPHWLVSIKERLQNISTKTDGISQDGNETAGFVGGGTDLYVQKHDELKYAPIRFLFNRPELNGITRQGNKCFIGGSATVTDLQESAIMLEYFPQLLRYIKFVSSTPIRNMATIAGNFINASPIGDFTIFFLALDASIVFSDGKAKRELPLRKLYKGYKQLDKGPAEFIEKISFELPGENSKFHFEKVSKRTWLDIATVNTAISITMNGDKISGAGISAGGVAPIPMYLQKTSGLLKGKKLTEELIKEAVNMAQTEVSPISDARGSEEYKRFLLGQLIKAHFIELFPGIKFEKILFE